MRERLQKMKGIIEAQAEMLFQQIDLVLGELAESEKQEGCPDCGAVDKLEDTSTGVGHRVTCLACGKSHYPELEAVNNG